MPWWRSSSVFDCCAFGIGFDSQVGLNFRMICIFFSKLVCFLYIYKKKYIGIYVICLVVAQTLLTLGLDGVVCQLF